MKRKVFEAKLKDLVPLYHNGAPIYQRYSQIRNVLLPLGEQYAELLCEPQIVADKVIFMSSYVQQPMPFTTLDPASKQAVQNSLNNMLSAINQHCSALRADGRAEYASIIELAVSVPGYQNILVENGRVVLTAWGFASNLQNGTQQSPLPILSEKISIKGAPVQDHTKLSAPAAPGSAGPITTATPPAHTPPPVAHTQTTATPPPPPHNTPAAASTPPTPPPVSNNNAADPGSTGGWKKNRILWFLAGILCTLLLIFLLRSCDSCNHPDNTPNHNNGNVDNGNGGRNHRNDPPGDPFFDTIRQVPPVDTSKIVHDPDIPGDRPILSNAVNIALDRGVDTKQFIIDFSEKYDGYAEVVFADTTIKLLQVRVPDGEWKTWIDSLKTLPEVKLAFPNTLFAESDMPSDPGFHNLQQSWYFDDIEAPEAWKYTMGDTSVIVAIADNCFDLSHPELADKIVMPYNVNTGNSDVYVPRFDGNMHGTHVAGTAVGSINQGGVCGIAPKCKLMPIQIADDNGNMQSIGIVAAALYAIHHGASVVNFSLGAYFGELSPDEQQQIITGYGNDEAQFWNELFDFANEENCVFVLAAGNENILAGCDPFARSNKVLVVSAYQDNSRSQKAGFSNHGQYANISAPGVDIYSSVPGGGYDFLQGTSMAAPIVTGAVALLKSQYPAISAEEIVAAIKNSAKPLNTNPKIGPLLQIAKALKAAGDGHMLEIPENASDVSFAAGNWKSTSSLNNMSSGAVVEVFFHINADGTGSIDYVEGPEKVFSAPIDVKLEDGKLVITQTEGAVGEQEGGYDKCVFTASREGEGAALCHTIYEDGTKGADFNMIKLE